MPPFTYVAPSTVDEAIELLARHRTDAKVLAGGQSLMPLLNYRLAAPRVLVDINDLPLSRIHVEDGRLRLGALTRHATLEESREIRELCGILSAAASQIGNVRVRTLGTLGGSLAHADPAAELPLVMTALDAQLTLQGPRGRRQLAAAEFFRGPLVTALEPDELLVEVVIPGTRGMGYAFEEFSRRDGDFAIVAVATLVRVDRRGRLDEVHIAIGGAGPTPTRAVAAEDVLRGHEPTSERVGKSAALARTTLSPESDPLVSGSYRRHLVHVLVRRALEIAIAQSREAS